MVYFGYMALGEALALPNHVPGAEADHVADTLRKFWQVADVNLTASRFMGKPSPALAAVAVDHNE